MKRLKVIAKWSKTFFRYGLGFLSVLLLFKWLGWSDYFTKIVAFVSYYLVDQFFGNTIGFSFGLKKKKKNDAGFYVTQPLDNTKDNLKKAVKKERKTALAVAEEGNIHWIEQLNWRFNDMNFEGTLAGVVERTKKEGCHSFAILGDAGVGKTSVLSGYLVSLIEKNDKFTYVYFSLSSWNKIQTLEDWLEAELKALYRETESARLLIADETFVPVLDGLDQVPLAFRENAFEEINKFGGNANREVIFTCRPHEFSELQRRAGGLSDRFSVYHLLPLRTDQLTAFIKDVASRKHIHDVLERSARLREFACYPLYLFILSLVARDISDREIELLETSSDVEVFNKLWQKYDQYIFSDQRRASQTDLVDKHGLSKENFRGLNKFRTFKNLRAFVETPYKPEQERFWLQNLCGKLKTNFFIEELQPDLLPGRLDRFLYYFLTRVLCAMALSVAIGFYLAGPFDYLGAAVVGGVVAMAMMYVSRAIKRVLRRQRLIKNQVAFMYLINNFLFAIPIAISLMFFLGFTTPRAFDDMIFNGTFAVTEANIGIFMSFFMGVIFGLRDVWQEPDRDIKLVERLRSDYRQLFRFGIIGGILLGAVLASAAQIVLAVFDNSSFATWVDKNYYNMNLTMLAFCSGFSFGFPLFGILGLLKQSQLRMTMTEKMEMDIKPDHSVRNSLKTSRSIGLLAAIMLTIIFGSLMGIFTGEQTAIIKGVKVGLGGALLATLWFGGFDLIQHYTLKLLLFVRGYAPWSIIRFLENSSALRFTRRIGAGFEFRHITLSSYFASTHYPVPDAGKNNPLARFILPAVLVLLLFVTLLPFYHRYGTSYFWDAPHEIEFVSPPLFFEEIETNKFVVNNVLRADAEVDTLEITARGYIKIGEFTGYISASGTEAGFLGFNIGDVFDLSEETSSFCHGGLLVKRSNNNDKWLSFCEDELYSAGNSVRKMRLPVKNGDTLTFFINDREWQNNTGRFQVTIEKKPPVRTSVVSHRGAAGLAPENTIEAVKKGIALHADFIEVDVRQTRDNRLVLLHDRDVDRTTNGTGNVSDLAWPEINRLRVDHAGEDIIRVPLLDSVLAVVKGSAGTLLIEVKDPSAYTGIGSRLVRVLKDRDMVQRVVIFSFDTDFVLKLKGDYPELTVGIFSLNPWLVADKKGVDYVGVHFLGLMIPDLVWPSRIEYLHEKGKKVFAWTVDSPALMQDLMDEHVDGIITNRPDQLNALICH